MSELGTDNMSLLSGELAKIESPVDKAAFTYFYNKTAKEGLVVHPHYTFDQFVDGIAPGYDIPVAFADKFVTDAGLIPNYTAELTEKNGLIRTVPMLDALKGPFVQSVQRQRERGAVRIMAIHPSLATPYIIARSLGAAFEDEYGEDIRSKLFIVVGAYPAVMKYNFKDRDGNYKEASPVDFGRTIGNLVLTAPRTANTETKDEEKVIEEWMRARRATFKIRNREILSKPGNILIVLPAGRRVHRDSAEGKQRPPYEHNEYRPTGNLGYITELPVPTFVVGVDDSLLNNPAHPESIVNLMGDPRPWFPAKNKHVYDLQKRSAVMSSTEINRYKLEYPMGKLWRVGSETVRHSASPED